MQQIHIQYFSPTSKQSELERYIEEQQFRTNWDNVEHDSCRLPATTEQHY